LAPLGLRLSPAKTRIVHMGDGFDFLGFHIQWRRKRGTNQWYVYTFIADRPVKAVKAKIRALTHRTSQANMGTTLTRINQILRGWVNYFPARGVQPHPRSCGSLRELAGDPLAEETTPLALGAVPSTVHHRFRRWLPLSAEGVELFNPTSVNVTRYRYRGNKIPSPYKRLNHA
jgi:RNA-directed DNA polymerase